MITAMIVLMTLYSLRIGVFSLIRRRIPESILQEFLDAEPLYVPPVQAEILDEVGAIHIAYIINKFPWPLLSSSTKCRGSNTH